LTEKLVISGGQPLRGTVEVAGAKNSVLKLMAAALLTGDSIELRNVPHLSDVNVMTSVLRHLGCDVDQQEDDRLYIQARHITSHEAPYDLVRKMRASFDVLGSLLARFGEARVALPGGCSIGKRSVDLHVKGLIALGAEVEINHGYVEAKASRLVGAEIMLDTPSVGATENIMLAATMAEGATVISNAAQEPEIVDLANFLNTIGADVSGAGTNEIVINGVRPGTLHGTTYSVMPDRIEAATYLIAAAGTRGDVTVNNVLPVHLSSMTHKLIEMGADIEMPTPNTLRLRCDQRLQAQNIVTQPFPGFPTDLQAPFMALLSICDGVSIVKETIYENRFKQVGELKRMGADISVERDVAVVTGVSKLSGAEVNAHDLRAGAAMVIAALQAEGESELFDLHHLDRGYEHLPEKLQGLGASISRVEDTSGRHSLESEAGEESQASLNS
jgi:UDP-N-acetylglucosamine 1-carboxyvinyltransferase